MAAIVAAQTRGRGRFTDMVSFFEGVGTGEAAGHNLPARAAGAGA